MDWKRFKEQVGSRGTISVATLAAWQAEGFEGLAVYFNARRVAHCLSALYAEVLGDGGGLGHIDAFATKHAKAFWALAAFCERGRLPVALYLRAQVETERRRLLPNTLTSSVAIGNFESWLLDQSYRFPASRTLLARLEVVASPGDTGAKVFDLILRDCAQVRDLAATLHLPPSLVLRLEAPGLSDAFLALCFEGHRGQLSRAMNTRIENGRKALATLPPSTLHVLPNHTILPGMEQPL